MRCNSCKEEINPKLKFSIAKNVCPACGKRIFSEIEHFFRNQISDILDKNNVKYPEQVNAIVSDIIELIDNQAKGARDNGELGGPIAEIEENESQDRSHEEESDDDSAQRIIPTQEEAEFMQENEVILGEAGGEDPALDEIRKKVAKLKKKVRKTNVPKPITLSGN